MEGISVAINDEKNVQDKVEEIEDYMVQADGREYMINLFVS